MRSLTIIFFIYSGLSVQGQHKKTYFPVWTFQQKNTRIYGISVGLWNYAREPKNTTTNGIRLSLIGEGIIVPFAPQSPIAEDDTTFQIAMKGDISERINGISLAGTGSAGRYLINGITVGFIGQLNNKVNGISACIFINLAEMHNGIQVATHINGAYLMNGIQVAVFRNESHIMHGVQIGLYNKSKNTRGLQIGLWNVNERRKFPLINWNFRR
jgi:hypothetical protein